MDRLKRESSVVLSSYYLIGDAVSVLFNWLVGSLDLGTLVDGLDSWDGLDVLNSGGSGKNNWALLLDGLDSGGLGKNNWALLNGLDSAGENDGVLDGLDSAGVDNWVLDGLESAGVGQWNVVDELGLSNSVDNLVSAGVGQWNVVDELGLSKSADNLVSVGGVNEGLVESLAVDNVDWAGSSNSQDGQKNNGVHDEMELVNKQSLMKMK